MPGRFVTFEGGEGAGKSTQMERLRRRLEAIGIHPVNTREPGGSPRAEAIRRHLLAGTAKPLGPLAEALMFYAARRDHLDAVIRPALERGALVLCDRFSDSTRAYQGLMGHLDKGILRSFDRAVVGDTQPDLTFILDVPASVSMERAAARRAAQGLASPDRFEAEGRRFHEDLRKAFLSIAAAEPWRCVVIEGNLPADEVEARIWAVVESRILDRGGASPRSTELR